MLIAAVGRGRKDGRRGGVEHRRSRIHSARREDDGAFLVVWALAAVSILLFAALAIDLGNIAQTKQHAQNSADSAALSAVGNLASIPTGGSAPAAESNAVTDAEAYVMRNDGSVGSTDWTDLAKCPVGAMPPGVTASSQTNCIGFFNPTDPSQNLSAPTGIAVAIPGRTVNYTFGQVSLKPGPKSQNVTAVGEASVQNPGSGHILPFGFSSGGSSGLNCLKSGSGNKAGACPGFAIGPGNFALLASPRYRVLPATPAPNGGQDPVIMADVDLGIDHQLQRNSSSEVCDANGPPPNCLGYNNVPTYDNANSVGPQPGQTLNIVGPGLFTAGFTVDGCLITVPRLAHPLGFVASGTCGQANPPGPVGPFLAQADTFGGGPNLNGSHITTYLVGDTTNPLWTQCYQNQGPPLPAPALGNYTPSPANDAIDKQIGGTNVWTGTATTEDGCLSNFMATGRVSSPIFRFDIVNSPRFGLVPVVTTTPGKSAARIIGFDAVFLDNASGTGNKVDAVSAWVFPFTWITPGQVGGGGLGSFNGGPFVANLCSLVAGNC